MNRFRKRALFPLMAMLLLAAATMVLAGGRATGPVSSTAIHAAHLSSVLSHGDANAAVASIHDDGGVDQGHAARMANGLPCDVACLASSSGCVAPLLVSRAGGLAPRTAGTVCLQPGNDLMLDSVIPDARLKPPKLIA